MRWVHMYSVCKDKLVQVFVHRQTFSQTYILTPFVLFCRWSMFFIPAGQPYRRQRYERNWVACTRQRLTLSSASVSGRSLEVERQLVSLSSMTRLTTLKSLSRNTDWPELVTHLQCDRFLSFFVSRASVGPFQHSTFSCPVDSLSLTFQIYNLRCLNRCVLSKWFLCISWNIWVSWRSTKK